MSKVSENYYILRYDNYKRRVRNFVDEFFEPTSSIGLLQFSFLNQIDLNLDNEPRTKTEAIDAIISLESLNDTRDSTNMKDALQ